MRKKGKNKWINLGGRTEDNENHFDCLKREIKEEIGCEIEGEIEYFLETPATPALDDPDKTVKIVWYKVKLIDNPTPSNEIEELRWVNPNNISGIELSPQIREYLIPKLSKV